MMYDDGEYYYSATEVFSSCLGSTNNSNKKKLLNKKRFSDEQVRSLESIFENETKLEPKKKVEVAKQLGLQPRQVAIWFQNKRARYKSKQLEGEYALLQANYNALSSQFENLKKEKYSLFLQLQKLKHENQGCNSTKLEDGKSEKEKEREEWEGKPALSMEGSDHGASCILSSSDEGSSENNNNNNNNNNDNEDKKNSYLGVVEELERDEHIDDEMLRMSMMEGGSNNTVQLGVGSSSLSDWDDYSDDPEGLFDHQQTAVDSCNHWWEFWSS